MKDYCRALRDLNTLIFGQTSEPTYLMIPGMQPDLERHLTTVWLSASLILPPKQAFPPLPYSQLFLLLKKTLFAEVTLSRL